MALLSNVEISFVRCDPKFPNAKMDKKNPKWECRISTTDPAQREEWLAKGVKAKLVVEKEGSPNEGEPILKDGKRQWSTVLSKRSKKSSGEAQSPVEVVDGNKEPVDPNTIANGSIANLRLYQYDYEKADGTPAKANVLMGIQLVRHIVRKVTPREEFGVVDTEVIYSAEEKKAAAAAEGDDVPFETQPKAPGAPSMKPVTERAEESF